MISSSTLADRRGMWAFALGVIAVTSGVLLHLPMFLMGRMTHFQLYGMPMGVGMYSGMGAIVLGVAIAAGLVQVWMNVAAGIVGEDNPANMGFFGVGVTAIACAFVARLKAADMARAMAATALVQALLGVVVATAPSTAWLAPHGPIGIVILSSGLVAMWLGSAALFHRAARASIVAAA